MSSTAIAAGAPVRIAAVATASPPRRMSQEETARALEERYGGEVLPRTRGVMRKVFANPSVRERRFGFGRVEEVFDEDPDARMDRFARWAVEMARDAGQGALASARIEPCDLAAVVVNTCTGYLCPGVSTYLVDELGLRPETLLYDLVGAGCGGAVPNLQTGRALAAGRAAPVLCISTEVCSATFRMGDDLGLVVSNALFADGAGAAVLRGGADGLALVDTESLTLPAHREHIRYVYRGGALQNQLSLGLPAILARETPRVVGPLLARSGLAADDVRHWAIHPGGEKVIDRLRDALGLSEDRLRVTREVLRDFGNLSSATVWFEMERILRAGVSPGEHCVMLAAGAGLSIHAALFQA